MVILLTERQLSDAVMTTLSHVTRVEVIMTPSEKRKHKIPTYDAVMAVLPDITRVEVIMIPSEKNKAHSASLVMQLFPLCPETFV